MVKERAEKMHLKPFNFEWMLDEERPPKPPPGYPERAKRKTIGPKPMSGKNIMFADFGQIWGSITIPNEIFNILGYKSAQGLGGSRAKRRPRMIIGLGTSLALLAGHVLLTSGFFAQIAAVKNAIQSHAEEPNVEVEFYEEEVYERIEAETKEGLTVALEERRRFIRKVVTRRDRPPSAPGEPWVSQTGQALRSIDYQVTVTDEDGEFVRGRIGSHEDYVRWLELGRGRLDPRPTIRPAILNHKGRIMEKVIEKA